MQPILIIWRNNRTNTYYYRYLKYFYSHYYVGYTNQYNHTVILVIPLNTLTFIDKCKKFLKRSIKRLTRFLDKLQNNL